MKHILILAALTANLTGCGGGSSNSSPDVAAKAHTKTAEAITKPLENIVNTLPTPAKSITTTVTVGGKHVGIVTGKDNYDIVARVVTPIIDAPSLPANVDSYRALLSAEGLIVVLKGQQTGVGSVSGLPVYGADQRAVAKLTANGLVITF